MGKTIKAQDRSGHTIVIQYIHGVWRLLEGDADIATMHQSFLKEAAKDPYIMEKGSIDKYIGCKMESVLNVFGFFVLDVK